MKGTSWIGLIAKRDIARNWMAKKVPALAERRAGMDWAAKTEESVYISLGSPKKHDRIWGKWWEHFGLSSK